VNVTALCFLFQHGNVNTTLVDNGAGSVTEQKAIEVFSSKHLHDQISSTHKQHNRKFSPVLTVNRHSERAPHPTSTAYATKAYHCSPLFSIPFSTTALVTICGSAASWLHGRLGNCIDCRSV